MNTLEILRYLDVLCKTKNGHCTYEVVPCDKLLSIKIKHYPICIVCNNMPENHGGEHWISFFQESDKSAVEFFCSYGKHINSYDVSFKKFVNMFTNLFVQTSNNEICSIAEFWF